MLKDFLNHVKTKKLFTHSNRILLALSGGADSVALFYLLKQGGFRFEASHVNYNLRDQTSQKDADFVVDLCQKENVPCHVLTLESEFWNENLGNIQDIARDLRYSHFKSWLGSNEDLIVTAHHLEDNLETVLMNFTRGTGLKGLAGIPEKNDQIVRPLLPFSKQQILNYLKRNAIKWRDDPTNQTLKYQRNRIRHQVIPVLKQENPALNIGFMRFLERMKVFNHWYQSELNLFTERYVDFNTEGLDLKLAPDQDLKVFLYDILAPYGFNGAQIDSILKSSHSGKRFLSQDYTLTIDRDRLLVYRNKKDQLKHYLIQETMLGMHEPIKMRIQEKADLTIDYSPLKAQFDLEKLHFPLILRKWKPGDAFRPLGLKGRKKISDMLIDQKVPLPEKRSQWVIESQGKIIWLVGRQMADFAKISSKTKRIFELELLKTKGN